MNYNREGKTTLAAQGWVNKLNMHEELTPTNAANDDEPDAAKWVGKTGFKALTSCLLGNVYHTLRSRLMCPCSEQENVWSHAFKLI